MALTVVTPDAQRGTHVGAPSNELQTDGSVVVHAGHTATGTTLGLVDDDSLGGEEQRSD
jgi:hypothetical protein